MTYRADNGRFLPATGMEITESGELVLAGIPARELAARFGTPLVIILEDEVRKNCREYMERVKVYPRSRIYFASKALLTVGFAKLIEQEGLGLDVVSSGELFTALSAGFPPEMIMMHGNAKTREELTAALKAGVGRIAIDNLAEIELLSELTAELGVKQKVLLRVTPGIKPSTHRYVQTGQMDSKFGFNLSGGAAEEAAKLILSVEGLELVGLHCHIGSQLYDLEAFSATARIMLEFYAFLQKELGAPLDELNMGGGLGISYQPADAPPDISTHLAKLVYTVLGECSRLGIEPPVLCDEPGRSIVGEAGVTLYTVQSVKKIPGIRNYVSVDGGMTDNPRFALYEARHHTAMAERMLDEAPEYWSVSGKCCETGDMLIKDVLLPEPRPGELLAMFSTGAYTYSMASNYNRVARPAVVLASQGRAELLVRRETAEDLVSLDEIPSWLCEESKAKAG